MKKFGTSLATFVAAIVFLGSQASALSPYQTGQVGVDISWPNCSASVPAGTPFGVVGVSYGRAYSVVNPCLGTEAANFPNGKLSLYANTGLNIDKTSPETYYQKAFAKGNCAADLNPDVCGARSYGYYAGQQIAQQSIDAGVKSPNWWLDIETVNTWNGGPSLDAQSIQGEYDGIHSVLDPVQPGVVIGAYSTNYQWNTIAGSFKPGWNVWYATAERRASAAIKYCDSNTYSFAGGPVQLVQFKGKIDQDYAC